MKIDRFDYKTTKSIILDLIEELGDDQKVDTTGFIDGYCMKDYSDVKKDINKVIKELKKLGIELYPFIQEHENEIFSDSDFIETQNGLIESILYSYDNKKGLLNGVKMSELSEIEFLIKYTYGYHNYDMGRRFLLQSYDSLKDYYEDSSKKILLGLLAPDYDNTNINEEYYITEDVAKEIIKQTSITKEHNGVYTIYVRLNLLHKLLLEKSGSQNHKPSDDYDDFLKYLENDLSGGAYEIIGYLLEIFIGHNQVSDPPEEFDDLAPDFFANKYNL